MKFALLASALLLSFSAMAFNCDSYLVLSEVDGRPDLTNKIIEKFEANGYNITRVSKVSDIKEEGSVSYMTIFSDVNSQEGAKTSIKMRDINVRGGIIGSSSSMDFSMSKKPLFGSAENALLKSVEKSIPACTKKL